MTKVRNNFLTKVAALLLSFAMLLGMLPLSYITAFALNGSDYGTFSIITSGGSVTEANGENAVATFNDLSLNWAPADPSVGRTSNGWWIGVKMTAPANMKTSADFAGASGDPNNTDGVTYQRCTSAANDTWTNATSFWRAQDSDKNAESTERYLTMWGMINEQYINEALATGTAIYYKWRFDWDKDGDYEQTATLKVEPQNIKLIKDSLQVYPATTGLGTVTPYGDELTVDGDANSNYIKVSYSADTILNWVEKNETIGRMQDGWWAGIKMTAPSTLQNAADFAGASGDPTNTTDCISYQSKSSDGWSAAKSFWRNKDSADSAAEHFIGLWGLLNVEYLKRATTTLSYMWRFDWNNDKVYEQIVVIEIEPSHITLKNESGIQVYPELGDVTTYTGGTVTGTKSGNVVVNISDNVTLNWSPKDLSIGRYADGWWAGIKITAPENIVLTADDDVKYQSKVGDNDWSQVKSFYNNQDSAKDAAIHYMGMWTVLDRTKLSTAIANNQKLTTQWRFDWDKDGVYEQLVTLNIDPQKITLKRVDRTDFVFADAATNKEVWVGDGSIVNKAESLLAPGIVTYEIDRANTTVSDAAVDNDGKVTFESIGKITVKATIAEDDVYNAKTISYSFNVVKKQPENLKFRIEVPSDITFGNNIVYENTINVPSDCKVIYSIKSQEKLESGDSDVSDNSVATIDENTGTVTVKRSGKITVLATITDDDPKYKDKSAEYSLTIKKAEQTGFAFTTNSPEAFVYSATAYDTVKVEGGQVDGAAIKYEITEGTDIAEIVDESKIKTLKAGDFKLSVTKPGNDCYNPVTINREMKVTLAEQTTFAFTYPNPSNIIYNENGNKYENIAINGESTGDVTYRVVLGNDVADFENPLNPAELKIKKAGTVRVEATKAADDRYNAKTISYDITVERAEQSFTFADGNSVVKKYGIKNYTNTVIPTVDTSKADGIGHGNGTFSYSIEENNIGATINTNTGEITFVDSEQKIGSAEVTVTRAEDEKYKSCTKKYTIEIEYPAVPATPYTIDKTVNENGWYNGDIKISAPEGYSVSYENKLSTTDWASYITYATEGTTCPLFYLKAANGDITDAITVEDYKMDKSEPTGLSISYDLTIWETILEKVFGFNAERVSVTLKAEDAVSGIDYVCYSLDNGSTYPDSQKVQLVNGEYQFVIPTQFRNIIKFKAVDMAGNITKYSDGKTVVVDPVVPDLDVEYDYSGLNRKLNDIIYTNDKVTVNFILEAANFDLSVAPVVKINGEEQVVVWNSNGNEHTTNILLTDTDDYTVTCDFVDRLGRAQSYSQEIHVDKVAPVISGFEFTPGEVRNTVSKRNYYDDDQTAKVVITEHNFDPSFINLEVEADNVAVDATAYLTDYKKIEKWTPGANDTWVAEIPFTEDANYTVTLSYTDLAGNSKTSNSYEFTVDTTAPEKPIIKLDKAFLAKVAETVTFGFYKAPVEVTVTSSDITAGIKEIKYSYVGKKGEYNEAVVNVSDTVATDNNTIKFTIPANTEFKGIVSATAYDWSMNDSVEQSVIFDKDSVALGGIVVDNIAPERTVLITEANRVVDANTLLDVENYDYTKENTNSILYYNDKATLTFIIDEANFYSEDVHVYVNGVETNPTDWAIVNNKGQGTITLSDEGDYIVTMEYTDKSTNIMTPYKSEKIVIDKTAPIISTEYHNKNIINTVNGREYYDSTQTATITVKEHNFRADDFKVKIYAKNINGNNVLTVDENGYVKSYAEDGAKRSEWTDYTADWRRVDDTYQLTITYSADANYTFDAEYTDLATNTDNSEVKKEFTVDTTPPEKPTIKLDKSLLNQVLETVTFGFFKAPVEVTVTSSDITSGVKEIKYSYVGKKGEYNEDVVNVSDTVAIDNNTIKFTIPANTEFKGIVSATAYDWSMNESAEQNISNDKNNDELGGIVLDNIAPERKVYITKADRVVDDTTLLDVDNYDYSRENTNSILYYNNEATLTFMIDEANFYKEDVHIFVNGTETVLTEDWRLDNNQFVGKITLTDEGDYVVEMTYEDKSKNQMTPYKSERIVIDKTDPIISAEYHNNNIIDTVENRKYYDSTQTATITVTEHNFRADDFKVKVYAKDINDNDVLTVDENGYVKSYAEDGAKRSEWTDYTADWRRVDDTYQLTITYSADANYTFDAEYTDLATNKDNSEVKKEFTVDTTPPEKPTIKLDKSLLNQVLETVTFGFFKAPVEVTVTSSDITSGVKEIKYSYVGKKGEYNEEVVDVSDTVATDNNTIKFTIPANTEFKGIVSATSYDWSMNDSEEQSVVFDKDGVALGGIVVDNINPDVRIEFTGSLKDTVDIDVDGQKPTRQTRNADAATRYVYDSEIVATITAKEANFYDDMTISVTKDNAVAIEGTDYVIGPWLPGTADDEHIKTVTLKTDGDYVITAVYSDKSQNDMNFESYEYSEKKGTKTYVSNIHTIDTTAPEYSITYDNNTVINSIDGRDYFDANRTATIKVTDRNFRPNEVVFSVDAKDVTGTNDITAFTYSDLKSWDDWTQDGITWTATIPFDVDANYTVTLDYKDIAEHKMINAETKAEETYSKLFTVDKVDPDNLTIKYIEPTFIEKVIENVTFHFYKAPVKVEISATDDISGVYHFMYSYAKSTGVSEVNAELLNETITNANIAYSGNKATATFTIPKEALANNNQFRGNVEFTAYDRSENKADTDDSTVIVVDNVAPHIDVSYTANDAKTEVRYVNGEVNDVKDFKSATHAFYNGDVTAEIKINEANFFEGDEYTDEEGRAVGIVHEVGIMLTKTDNNGVVTKTEYLPAGSIQMFASETSNMKNIEWTNNGDIHTFKIDYDENADYVLTVKYADFSTNKSNINANDGKSVVETYESKVVTVDKIDPVIEVEYSNTDVKNTIDGRKYLDKQQVATITVTEHNFRADDVDVDVIAKNVIDEDVSVENFDAQLRNRSNWKHYDENGNEVDSVTEGDVHVATITYSVDANYTFDIEYADLAKRVSKDYDADLFTVDKTAPTNLTVTYSEPKLWDKILESITFGFYNAQMEVTVTSDDITSGIYHFKYSYIKSEGVSDVNAELIDQAISDANITYTGKTATAKFNIPKLVLKNDNQFNGTVKFTAYDRSENNTDMADEERIVVDNIKPTSKITYNEPIQNANNISYYAGDINATIVINEANFYSKDVNVTVTKDGTNYPVTVQWKDDSVDVHTGTFTLTEDGDYIVTVKYADRSTNEMDTYESNRLTIDTKAPTVSVSNIKNNSANKDEKYGFTITANDVNIDMNSIKPVLTAVVRGENGNYSTKTISLGDMRTVDAGKTYSYTVDNLEDDAVYTLVCTLKDMSGNEYSKIGLADGKEYETVRFSVNRDGSTFAVNEASAKLLEQYYVYSVNEDVVIEEINVDPIENYTVKLNGVALSEGKDYTTTVTNNNGEWSKRTYVVKKSLFEKEGEYSIIVESIDKAETTAFSDVKNLKVAFVVDQTAPVLTISGLEEGGRYQIDEQTVTIIPTDDGGKLNSFKAILLDSNGKEIEVRFEMSGDDLIKYLEENDGKITFTVPEGLENQVRIICDDCAVNAEGKTNAYDNTFTKVTVSQSGWVIYYANKPLFYGSIGGVIAIAGGTFSFVFFRKRRKLVP